MDTPSTTPSHECVSCRSARESHLRTIEYLRRENSDQGSEIMNLVEEIEKLKKKLQQKTTLIEKIDDLICMYSFPRSQVTTPKSTDHE